MSERPTVIFSVAFLIFGLAVAAAGTIYAMAL